MMQFLEFILEALKWTGMFALLILSIFLIGLIFLFVASLLIMAIYLAVSCACELWDIYIKNTFKELRNKRNKRKENNG